MTDFQALFDSAIPAEEIISPSPYGKSATASANTISDMVLGTFKDAMTTVEKQQRNDAFERLFSEAKPVVGDSNAVVPSYYGLQTPQAPSGTYASNRLEGLKNAVIGGFYDTSAQLAGGLSGITQNLFRPAPGSVGQLALDAIAPNSSAFNPKPWERAAWDAIREELNNQTKLYPRSKAASQEFSEGGAVDPSWYAENLTRMVPSLAAQALSSIGGPALFSAVSGTIGSGGHFDQAYQRYRKQGLNDSKAKQKAAWESLAVGSVTAAIDKIGFSRVFGKSKAGEYFLTRTGKAAATEAATEQIQELATIGIETGFSGESQFSTDAILNRVLPSGALGSVAGGGMRAVGEVGGIVPQSLKLTNEDAIRLVEQNPRAAVAIAKKADRAPATQFLNLGIERGSGNSNEARRARRQFAATVKQELENRDIDWQNYKPEPAQQPQAGSTAQEQASTPAVAPDAQATPVSQPAPLQPADDADTLKPHIIDSLKEADPELKSLFEQDAGVKERLTIEQHTRDVLNNWKIQMPARQLSDLSEQLGFPVAELLQDAVALHDIGKPYAVKKGRKSLQHKYTKPILDRVLRSRGYSDSQIAFATALIDNDAIGDVLKSKTDALSAAKKIRQLASQADVSPRVFLDTLTRFYKSDAGSYPELRKNIFKQGPDGQLTIPNIEFNILEEAIYGQALSSPWLPSTGIGIARSNGSALPDTRFHGSARRFVRPDAGRVPRRPLLFGRGFYLTDTKSAGVYARAALDAAVREATKGFSPRLRNMISEIVMDERIDEAKQLVEQLRQQNPELGNEVLSLLNEIEHGKLGRHVIEFKFDPKKPFEIGFSLRGRMMSPKEKASIVGAVNKVTGQSVDANSLPSNAGNFYQTLAMKIAESDPTATTSDSKNAINQALLNLGYDSIFFVHPGGATKQRHKVVVALDPRFKSADPSGFVVPIFTKIGRLDIAQWAKKQLKRWGTSLGDMPDVMRRLNERRIQRIRSINKQGTFVIHDLEKAVKNEYGKSFNELPDDIFDRLSQSLNDRTIAQTLPPTVRTPVLLMREMIDNLSIQLKGAGILSEELEIVVDKKSGEYSVRSYRMFDDPKYGIESIPKTILNAARQWYRENSGEGVPTDDRSIDLVIGEFLRTKGQKMPPLRGRGVGTNDLTSLKHRQEIPKELRDLMGEYKDPRVNFQRTVLKLTNMIETARFQQDLADVGIDSFLWRQDNPNRPEGLAAIKPTGGRTDKSLGPLNGLLTYPEIRDLITGARDNRNLSPFFRVLAGASLGVKVSKTILSSSTQIRNVISGVGFLIKNGVHPRKAFKAVIESGKLLTAEMKGSTDEAVRHAVAEYTRRGIIGEDITSGELEYLLRAVWTRSDMEFLFDEAQTADIIAANASNKLKGPIKKLWNVLQKFYVNGDALWKIAGYELEKARYRHAFPNEESLSEFAAERVKQQYPTYGRVFQWAKALRLNPTIGTFVSFPAEVFRNDINILKQARQDIQSRDPKIMRIGFARLAGLSLYLTTPLLAAMFSMSTFGTDVTDEEDQAVRELKPDWEKAGVFVYAGRDEYGVPIAVDFSYLYTDQSILKPLVAVAHNRDPKQALDELTSPFISPDISTNALVELWKNYDAQRGKPIYDTKTSGWDFLKDFMGHYWKAARPGVANDADLLIDAIEGRKRSDGRVISVEQAFWRFFGIRSASEDPAVKAFFAARGYKWNLAQSNQHFTTPAKNRGYASEQELINSYRKMEESRRKNFEEMSRIVQAAVLLSDQETVFDAIGDTLSLETKRRLLAGDYEPWKPSKAFLEAVPEDKRERVRGVINAINF